MKRLIVILAFAIAVFAIVGSVSAQDIPQIHPRILPVPQSSCQKTVQFEISSLNRGVYLVYRSGAVSLHEPCGMGNYHLYSEYVGQVVVDYFGQTVNFSHITVDGQFTYFIVGRSVEVDTRSVNSAPVCTAGVPSRILVVGSFAKVSASAGVNIRIAPGLSSVRVKLTPLAYGSEIHIVDGPSCVENQTWWRVDYRDGNNQLTGWMLEHNGNEYLLEPVPDRYQAINYLSIAYGAATPNPWMILNTKVRSSPEISQPNSRQNVIAEISPGEVVRVHGRNLDSSWLHVLTKDGVYGWTCSHLLYVNMEHTQGLPIHSNTNNKCHLGSP